MSKPPTDEKARMLPRPANYGAVSPDQYCSAFVRSAKASSDVPACRNCRSADFQTEELKTLGVGLCCWPHIMND